MSVNDRVTIVAGELVHTWGKRHTRDIVHGISSVFSERQPRPLSTGTPPGGGGEGEPGVQGAPEEETRVWRSQGEDAKFTEEEPQAPEGLGAAHAATWL